MHYNKIIEGVIRFIDRKYVPLMNDLQIAGYYIAAEALRGNPEGIINTLTKNPLVKMLVMPGKDGEINLDRIMPAIKRVAATKGQIAFTIPGYGKFAFNEAELDELYNTIQEVI